jgi:hypothetical protein
LPIVRLAFVGLLLVGLATCGGVTVAAPRLNPGPAPAPATRAVTVAPAAALAPRVTEPIGPTIYPLPAPGVQPEPCPLPPWNGTERPTTGTPEVATADLPAPAPLTPRQVNLRPVTGKGMWWTVWPSSDVDVNQMVARAKSAGLNQIWVRTGGTRQGWYGAPLLKALLPVAHAAGLAVVAWDYPTLSDPLADVARARQAIGGTFGGARIDAFSPDIETPYEGTHNSVDRVRRYLSLVRATAGALPVIATVMNPTPANLETYPYAAEAPYVDAFAPMVYWSCNEPGAAAAAAVAALAKLRPVHLIGQAYNMIEDGGRRGLPSGAEEWRFLDVANSAGAIGASLYAADSATKPEWAALAAYPWTGRRLG